MLAVSEDFQSSIATCLSSVGGMSAVTLLLWSCTPNLAITEPPQTDADFADLTPDLTVTDVYTVQPNIVAVRLEVGKTLYGQQVPYESDPHDQIQIQRQTHWLKRDNQELGVLVGRERDILYPYDQYEGGGLDTDWVDQTVSYHITSVEDINYKTEVPPITVFRKSKPKDIAHTARQRYDWPMVHTVYLNFPQPLNPDKTYQLMFPGSELPVQTFKYEPEVDRSEAVHISHLGFRPDDPAKVAFLSLWMGNGGGLDYPAGLDFWLINEETNQKMYTGVTQLSVAKDQPEDPRDRNYNGADVYLMDFSDFQTSGQYRLCVAGIGCSFSFEIGRDSWKKAFQVSARGFYHQRSGIALKPPYTTFERPRPYHPDDGFKVYQSLVPLMDTDMGIGRQKTRKALRETRTDELLSHAWGGYFDAGDWDRRIQHLEAARLLLELVELFPDYFRQVNLNIPESDNALPDVVDEALWGVDFFSRLQAADGGIGGGIESAGPPKSGEMSWQESWSGLAYGPGIWSSYEYAGVAARAAHRLMSSAPELALEYQASALQAMQYAEREYAQAEANQLPFAVHDSRNLAAVELFRLTEEEHWGQLFLETTVFADPSKQVFEPRRHQQREAAFVYTRLQTPKVDARVQRNAIKALLREADTLASLGAQTGFKWTKLHPHTPVGWGGSFGSPKVIPLMRAHVLTGDVKYLEAAVLACQFSAGANPDNLVYTTGLGHRSPQHPLIIDQRIMGTPPPPGITVYGPLDLTQFKDYWTAKYLLKDITFPNPWAWPTAEAYFDIYRFPAVTEFTIHQTMAPTAYAWGYLAARNSTP